MPNPEDLTDLGGPEPLTLRDRPSVLRAASDCLLTYAREQPEGSERAARLYLLAGYVMGASALFVKQPD